MENGPIQQAFEDSIGEMSFEPKDRAAIELARHLASQMDVEEESAPFVKLADSYLRTLESLQMTPRARALAQKGITANEPDKPQSRLDELRERRARKSRTEAVDTATS